MMARKSGEGIARSIRTSSTKVFGEPAVEPASSHWAELGWTWLKYSWRWLVLGAIRCLALVSCFRSTSWQKGFKLLGNHRKDPKAWAFACRISWAFRGVNFFVGPGSKNFCIFCYEMEAHLCVTYPKTTLVGCVGVPPYTGTIVDGC